MFSNSTDPFTWMSAGGTVAVWATTSNALLCGTAARSLRKTVTAGLSALDSGRCTTTSQFDLPLTEKVLSSTVSPFSLKVIFRDPAFTLYGPTTAAVSTLTSDFLTIDRDVKILSR